MKDEFLSQAESIFQGQPKWQIDMTLHMSFEDLKKNFGEDRAYEEFYIPYVVLRHHLLGLDNKCYVDKDGKMHYKKVQIIDKSKGMDEQL